MAASDDKDDAPSQAVTSSTAAEAEVDPSPSAEALATPETTTQHADSEAAAAAPSPQSQPQPEPQSALRPPTLDQARAFLRDDSVRRESRERKAAFLASKGLPAAQVDQLLEEEAEVQTITRSTTVASSDSDAASSSSFSPSTASSSSSSIPPIVTYPEFLARPQRPPPLMTPGVFLNTLYSAAAAASLIYGGARFVLGPMVDALNDARGELHEAAGTQLERLITQLEGVVSVVPEAPVVPDVAKHTAAALADSRHGHEHEHEEVDSDVSTASTTYSYDDPTEVFHRDIGVQTSMPPSPTLAPVADTAVKAALSSSSSPPASTAAPEPSPVERHVEKLTAMTDAVKSISEAGAASTAVLADIQSAVTVFRDDVDKLSRPPIAPFGTGGYIFGSSASKFPGYVTTTRNEPEDEIRRAKENIRRVKGALLTTRTFPTAR